MGIVYLFKSKFNDNEELSSVLRKVFGFGTTKMNYLFLIFKLNRKLKLNQVEPVKLKKIEQVANQFNYGPEFYNYCNAKLLNNFIGGSYKELRLSQGLPVNGQRTRSNSRTAKQVNFKKFRYLTKLRKK